MNSSMALARPLDPAAPVSAEPDPALVRAASKGRPEAREELARRHRDAAYLLALQLIGNREDALDVAQDALLKFFGTLSRFDSRRAVKPWLLAIVRNQARDFFRRQKIRRTEALDDPATALLEPRDPGGGPEHDLARRRLARRVWNAIARLDSDKREILVLRDFHDLSYAELSSALGIPQGTVMSRLHAGRRQLRARLEEGPE